MHNSSNAKTIKTDKEAEITDKETEIFNKHNALIIIVTYNSQDFIKKCLDSVFNSLYKDWLLVIIDNNSCDNTVNEILSFSETSLQSNQTYIAYINDIIKKDKITKNNVDSVYLLEKRDFSEKPLPENLKTTDKDFLNSINSNNINNINTNYINLIKSFLLIKLNNNIGFSGAVNFLVFNILNLFKNSFKFLILLNPDVVLDKNAIENVISTFQTSNKDNSNNKYYKYSKYNKYNNLDKAEGLENDAITNSLNALNSVSNIGAAGGLIFDYEGKNLQNAGGKILCNFLTYHLNLTCNLNFKQLDCLDLDWLDLKSSLDFTDLKYKYKVYEVDYVCGAFFATKFNIFKYLNGFDIGYKPVYFEELDYCLKLKRLGLVSVINTGAKAFHYESASIQKFSYNFYKYYHKNRIRCAVINSGIKYFFKKFLPCEFNWFLKLKKIKNAEAKAVILAYFLNFLFLPYNLSIKFKNYLKIKKVKF